MLLSGQEMTKRKNTLKSTAELTLKQKAFVDIYVSNWGEITKVDLLHCCLIAKKVIKSKCFTGIISNLEVITTQESPIPTQMLEFIIENQIIDSSWSQCNERAKEEDSPPAVKKKKVT